MPSRWPGGTLTRREMSDGGSVAGAMSNTVYLLCRHYQPEVVVCRYLTFIITDSTDTCILYSMYT